MVGTPAYMAPEQFAKEPVGPATDQFAFCVALWEALAGSRPFAGTTQAELARSVLQGNRCAAPSRSRVPPRIRRALDRGLSRDPNARWPSMDALVGALQSQGWWRIPIAVAGACGVGVAAWFGWTGYAEARLIAACEQEADAVEEVWNEGRRTGLRASLLNRESSYANWVAQRVIPWIDEEAAAWADSARDACVTRNRGRTWSQDVEERSAWCLQQRRKELDSRIRALEEGEDNAISSAVARLGTSEGAQLCAREAELLLRVPPLEIRERTDEVQADVAEALGLSRKGDHERAEAVARRALTKADDAQWLPSSVKARYALASALSRGGDLVAGRRELEQSFFEAKEAGEHRLAVVIGTRLEHLVGYLLGERAEAGNWSREVEMLLDLVPDKSGELLTGHLNAAALLARMDGEYQRVAELQERILRMKVEARGPRHIDVAQAANNLGNTYHLQGEEEQALMLHTLALEIRIEAFGWQHASTAESLNALGNVTRALGDRRQARALIESAHDIEAELLGPRSSRISMYLMNLAKIDRVEGRMGEAIHKLERAVAINEEALGTDHHDTARVIGALAWIQQEVGRYREAAQLAERALASLQLHGASPDIVGVARETLAISLWEIDSDRERAVDLAQRAREDFVSVGAANDDVARIDRWLATHRYVGVGGTG